MSRNADSFSLEEAVIIEPGNGATPTISSLRSAIVQAPAVTPDSTKLKCDQPAANVSPLDTSDAASDSAASSLDAQTAGRHSDVSPTSDFSSDADRRQADVKQTSIQQPRSYERQSAVGQPSASTSLSQESPQAVQVRSRMYGRTAADESGRYRHTVRLDPKIEDQLHIIMDELGVDMNAAISVCITAQYRQLKRSGNRGG